jgi:hypothetical protein
MHAGDPVPPDGQIKGGTLVDYIHITHLGYYGAD